MTERLYARDAYLRQCKAQVIATEGGIQLDRTVFYPTGGGQPGDTGVLRRADGSEVAIIDTHKGADDMLLHIPAADTLPLQVGETVSAEIDWQRRYRHMRMHTCLHLLCAVVGAGVTGGAIAADKGRLDFDLQESTLDKTALTETLLALIEADHLVSERWISDAELDAQPELVRTLSVQPPRGAGQIRLLEVVGVDLQPCGGTHVARTGEIGAVRVSKIEKKSRHNRRVVVSFEA